MMTPTVRGVYVADVTGIVPWRDTKHCVCVSVATGKYVLINTRHDKSHDDFMLSPSDYGFLMGKGRYLSCSLAFDISADRLMRKVGILSTDDTHKMAGKVIRSKTIPKADKNIIIDELREALRE